MSEEEKLHNELEENYEKIVEMLSNGNFLQLNGKAINLTELNEYINAQQEEIDRLNNIINELEKDSIAFKKFCSWIVNRHEPDMFHKMEIINKLQELKGSDKE